MWENDRDIIGINLTVICCFLFVCLFVYFPQGNLCWRGDFVKKWVWAVQHSMHHVDVVVDMKMNRAALPLSWTVSKAVYNLASLVLIMRSSRIHHPACQNGTEDCFVLVLFCPPTNPFLHTPKLFLICGCSPHQLHFSSPFLLLLLLLLLSVIRTCNV